MSTDDQGRPVGDGAVGDGPGDATTALPGASPGTGPQAAGGEEPPTTRRTWLVAAGLVTLLVVVAVVVWAAARGSDPTTTPGPSPSAPSGSGTTTGSPTTGPPTTEPTTEPTTGAGSGSGSATTAPTASGSAAATTAAPGAPVPTAIPADLTLPAEGSDGWTSRGWSYAPCGAQVSAAGSSDFRGIGSEGPEDSRTQSLLVFPTEDAAAAYLASLRTAAEACAGPGDGLADTPAVSVSTVEGEWDESLLVVESYPLPEGGYSPGGDYTLAARTGSAIAVSGGYAEWPPGYPTPAPAAVAEYRAALDQLAPRLCVFSADGC